METKVMPDEIRQVLELVARALEVVGAGALAAGFVVATVLAVRRHFREGARPAVARYRKSLGRVVLIGLEILVAATIIKTITLDPTWQGMATLAGMIAIRTVLGWTMVLEMYGRWPWQKPLASAAKDQHAAS
jgi:uncharacterized membrane protein